MNKNPHLYPFIKELALNGFPVRNRSEGGGDVQISRRSPRTSGEGKVYTLVDQNNEDYSDEGFFHPPNITALDLFLYFPEERNWAALALEGKNYNVPEGKVYIGLGARQGLPFRRESISSLLSDTEWSSDGYWGNSTTLHYSVSIPEWERQTGLIYKKETQKEMNTTKKLPEHFVIKTPTQGISADVQLKLYSLGYEWLSGEKNQALTYPDNQGEDGIQIEGKVMQRHFKNHDDEGMGREQISIPDLFNIQPEKEKPALKIPIGLIPAYGIKVTQEYVRIGRTNMPKEDWVKLAARINGFQAQPKLPETFFIQTPNKDFSQLIQKRLFEMGFSWALGGQRLRDENERFITRRRIGLESWTCDSEVQGLPEIHIADLFSTVKDIIPNTFQNRDVLLKEDGITVGCQLITWENWKQIDEQISNFFTETA